MLRIRKLTNEPTMTTERQYVHLNTVQSDISSSPVLIKYYKCTLSSHHNHLLIKPYRLLDFLKAQRRAKVCLLFWIVSHGASFQPTLSEYHSHLSDVHSLQQMLFLKNGLIVFLFLYLVIQESITLCCCYSDISVQSIFRFFMPFVWNQS